MQQLHSKRIFYAFGMEEKGSASYESHFFAVFLAKEANFSLLTPAVTLDTSFLLCANLFLLQRKVSGLFRIIIEGQQDSFCLFFTLSLFMSPQDHQKASPLPPHPFLERSCSKTRLCVLGCSLITVCLG